MTDINDIMPKVPTETIEDTNDVQIAMVTATNSTEAERYIAEQLDGHPIQFNTKHDNTLNNVDNLSESLQLINQVGNI